ncbi:MAG: hypothetical protein ABSE70_02720 [Candidatus Limnocylindrales bacterium]
MRLLRARGRGTEYPIEVELVATGDEPVEVVLSSTERHGSNDSGRQGDYPRRVTSGGRVAAFEDLSAEWSSVLPGVEARATAHRASPGRDSSGPQAFRLGIACDLECDRSWKRISPHHALESSLGHRPFG